MEDRVDLFDRQLCALPFNCVQNNAWRVTWSDKQVEHVINLSTGVRYVRTDDYAVGGYACGNAPICRFIRAGQEPSEECFDALFLVGLYVNDDMKMTLLEYEELEKDENFAHCYCHKRHKLKFELKQAIITEDDEKRLQVLEQVNEVRASMKSAFGTFQKRYEAFQEEFETLMGRVTECMNKLK